MSELNFNLCIFLFRASSQQHDMQAEQLVIHVIRFFFFFSPLTREVGKHVRSLRARQHVNLTAGERTDMTLCVIMLCQTNDQVKCVNV